MKKDNIVIIGGGGHAKVVISIVKKINNYKIYGYTDIKNRGEILGIKYLGNDDILEELLLNIGVKYAAIGIGQIKNFESRIKIIKKIEKIGFEFPVIISPNAVKNESVMVEKGTVVIDGVIINSGSKIGKFCIINTNSSVDHDCIIGDYNHIAPGVTICGDVRIGDKNLIGAGATIIQGKYILDEVIIGAGGVITKDISQKGIYIGSPAKRIVNSKFLKF